MRCPACGFHNPDGFRFCGQCAAALGGAAGPAAGSGSPAEGERKHATVMFSDLSGYTALTERLDPEEVKALMGRIFAEAGHIVEKYEGTVERFFGDEVMAVFGVPRVHEDDAVRAVRAALEIHAGVNALSSEYDSRVGRPLAMHTGINSGLVVTGDERIGKGRHGLTGDTINLAKRLTGLAGAGEIVIGPDTHRQAGGLFAFETLAPARVKGKAEPIPVYRLISAQQAGTQTAHRPRLGMERRIYAAMVGRERELQILVDRARELTKGRGAIVNVIGEAGIGKSRLIAEFKRSEALEKIVVLEGRAISIGRNLSFHPIVDLLRHWARIGEGDTPPIAFDKLARSVNIVAAEEADEIIPFVATLMGMKLTGEYARRVEGIEGEALERLILKNVRDLVTKAAGLSPVAVVMEDQHWADTSSIDLLTSLFRLVSSWPILFINVFRPGYEDTGERFSKLAHEELRAHCQEIVLEPLDAAMSETLIGNMLNIQGLPVAVKKNIVERAGGNPFFIEEVVRSFIDTGAIVNRNGRFEVTDRIDAVDVPGTIQDVLMARIDRLEEHTRSLVKIASVIGRNFFRKILVEVTHTLSDIDERLDHLKDIQLIREQKRLEEIEYLFKHALAQEAAYGSILHQRRKELHLDVAKAIEKVFHERLHEFYGLLALHYTRGEEWENAEHYLVKAGEEALRFSATSEALNYYQDGLRLYLDHVHGNVDNDKLAVFEQNIATALYNKGNWAEAVQHIDRVLKLWKVPTDPNPIIVFFVFLKNIVLLMTGIEALLSRRESSPIDNEIIALGYKKSKSAFFFDSMKFFFCGPE